MDLGPMLQHLFNSIYNLMQSFIFTISGFTVSLFQFFCWMIVAALVIRLTDWFRK